MRPACTLLREAHYRINQCTSTGSLAMTAITIEDLPRDQTLDREAMTCIHGSGGAPWVFGWITPYIPAQASSFGPVVNLYETTNNFYAGRMINQIQNTNVQNTGANSVIVLSSNLRSNNAA